MFHLFDEVHGLLEESSSSDEEEQKPQAGCQHACVAELDCLRICDECGADLGRVMSYAKEWRFYGGSDSHGHGDPTRCRIKAGIPDCGIWGDVKDMGFSHEVVYDTNKIYEQFAQGRIFRGKFRRSIIHACVTRVLEAMYDSEHNYEDLKKVFDIDGRTASRGATLVELHVPKTHAPRLDAVDQLVRDVMRNFNASREKIAAVQQIYHRVKNRSSVLNRSRSSTVACGVVRYYMLKHDEGISIADFRSKVDNLGEVTIKKVVNEIKRVLGE